MDQVAFFEQPTVSLAETSLLSPSPSDSAGSPEPCSHSDEKKPVKKRKSWGQELPTPKTNLPPRKRAKTEDEKEQRRIERVLRNRQAAQSSRERKRQEVEKLEGERDVIHHENRALKARLMAIEDEKDSMKRQLASMREVLRKNGLQAYSPPASPIISPKMFQEQIIKEENDDLTSLFHTPTTTQTIDATVTLPSTSAPTETSDNTLDLAQHPAEMLCRGLPCQSKALNPMESPMVAPDATASPQQLHQLLLYLTVHSMTYSMVIAPLFQLLASLKKGSRLTAETLPPTTFTLITWLISTPRSPLRPSNPTTLSSTATTTLTTSPLTSTPPTTRSSTFRTSLLRRLLTCSPALARPLRDATARALHEKTEYALRGMSDVSCTKVGDEEEGEAVIAGGQSSKADVWRLMTIAMVIHQFEKKNKVRLAK